MGHVARAPCAHGAGMDSASVDDADADDASCEDGASVDDADADDASCEGADATRAATHHTPRTSTHP